MTHQTKSSSRETCFAYVFARGGSKGLPQKNLKLLDGVSLMGRAITTAFASSLVDEVIVSTDCAKIAEEAIKYGACVPALRPAYLATDLAPEWLAWRHAIESLSPDKPDVFLSVPPTAPLRMTSDLDACIGRLQSTHAELVLSVTQPHRNPYFNQITLDEDQQVSLVMSGGNVKRRQDAPSVFDITTVAYAARPDAILKNSGIFDCDVRHVEVPVERSIDIDTPLDFAIAEFLHKRREELNSLQLPLLRKVI